MTGTQEANDRLEDMTEAPWMGAVGIQEGLKEVGALVEQGAQPDAALIDGLLKALRSYRMFPEILRGDAVLGGLPTFSTRAQTYVAQAMIDTDADTTGLHAAQEKLTALMAQEGLSETDRSEVQGLIGRAEKQLYVWHRDAGLDGGAFLAKAVATHAAAFDAYTDNAKLIWHGTNMVALAWRAARDGVAVDVDADRARIRLEEVVARVDGARKTNAWSEAAKAQCALAAGDRPAAIVAYRRYFAKLRAGRAPGGQAFTLGGDLRQLQEIWGLAGNDPLVRDMKQALLALTCPHMDPDTSDAIWDNVGRMSKGTSVLQAIIADGFEITLDGIKRLADSPAGICRVQSGTPAISTKGSGFVIEGRDAGVPGAERLLVTNAHVLGEGYPGGNPIPVDCAEVEFEQSGITLRVKEILWSGMHPDRSTGHDVVIARLAWEGQESAVQPLTLHGTRHPFLKRTMDRESLGFVIPVGHPGGGDLTFSLGENKVLDHQLDHGGDGPAYVHYAANTQSGSSGCPVLTTEGKVLAIHRSYEETPLMPRRACLPEDYKANAGIGLESTLKAARPALVT